jgi:hypothetical protein
MTEADPAFETSCALNTFKMMKTAQDNRYVCVYIVDSVLLSRPVSPKRRFA